MEPALLQALQERKVIITNNAKSGDAEDANGISDSDSDDESSSTGSSEDDARRDGEDAEEMSRRLGEQLWEDITNAKALEAASGSAPPTSEEIAPATNPPLSVAPAAGSRSQKQESVIGTVRTILSLLEKDPVARSTLASTTASLPTSVSVLDALKGILAVGSVAKDVAGGLSQSLVALARSERLFGKLRQSNESSNLGKRKRNHEQDESTKTLEASPKKRALSSFDLYGTVSEAVRVVVATLQSSIGKGPDRSLISSLQLPLHQIFLFAVTSSARGGPENSMLQEISGLIQVLAILSGITIGQIPDKQDIGTAVYPCKVAGCKKTFTRLFSLRTHERVHSSDRPYVCDVCPASFVRSHDLKRHRRVHGGKVWKCVGCNKAFSRRDAIKRHKNVAETRGPRSEACAGAEPVQIDTDDPEEEKPERRCEQLTRTWADHGAGGGGEGEEGEIPPHIIQNTQATVLQLQYVLQTYVTNASGTSASFTSVPMPADPAVGQATLASVIARAQSHNQAAPSEVHDLARATPSSDGAPNTNTAATAEGDATTRPSLSLYGLSEEQAKMLEEAITNAALAAQAQAEAEAALEEEDSDDSDSGGDSEASEDENESKSMLPTSQ
ncbi:hypothetical protein E1B28_000247 [Marasmius oreades]|uniref:C2H2-type domain-containing protein n=1 Tax=Marasmius oreades TaxID=181124 RepID=A0A9P7V0Z9_9AGAR|nr:uncharacterized protein E1B28_000247 [Marasmius oreades]KAG7098284.1 hypothetical protein E1B28_000247 [Marasmius oreades]